MPALMAIIGANADPMRRELAAVQRMAQQAGVNINRSMSGASGGHGGSSGIIRESIVLLRELATGRGLSPRTAGSFTILLQRMGILNLVLKDSSQASQILAAAWAQQAEAASLASIAAVRKAGASLAAFEADVENTEATLAQAVADEEGAAAAIMNAKAMQAKAVAAQESAAASTAATGVGIGALGIIGGIIVGIAAGAFAAYKLSSALVDKLSGLKTPNFHPEYIAKHLQAANQAAEGQKEINKEIQKSIDLYRSAAKQAERVAETTKAHFEHLRKMNSFQKDPRKKAERELEINKDEREALYKNKVNEQINLETESRRKKREADAINVNSKGHDENLLRQKKQQAEEAQKYLDDLNAANNGGDGSMKKKLLRGYNAVALSGVSGGDLDKAEEANKKEAYRRIKAYEQTVDRSADNDELRKKKEDLTKQAIESAAASASLAQALPDMAKDVDQKNADEEEESRKEQANIKGKFVHGHVNSLQQIGAFAAPAVLENEARKHTHLLHEIKNGIDRIGGRSGSSGFDRPRF